MSRDYYNRRVGKDGDPPRLTLAEAAGQLAAAYSFVEQQGNLQRSFGYFCVDEKNVAGLHGSDLRDVLYLDTGIKIAINVPEFLRDADEVGMFTLIEFVHDHVAKPAKGEGRFHDYQGCGWHYHHDGRFDEVGARVEWRKKVNAFLKFYEDGYELSTSGEIVRIAPDGTSKLVSAQLSPKVGNTDRAKVANAVRTFHLGRSTREQRKQAVRDLLDVLEFHRDAVKSHLSKDEGDLFNIANKFALRHHNANQKDDYDDAWLTWFFYVYLSTVHLVLGRIYGHEPPAPDAESPVNVPQPDAESADDDEIPF